MRMGDVRVDPSAFPASSCQWCLSVRLSLGRRLNFLVLVCSIFWSSLSEAFSRYFSFFPDTWVNGLKNKYRTENKWDFNTVRLITELSLQATKHKTCCMWWTPMYWTFFFFFFFFFFGVPQLYLWGSPLLGEILRMWPFFNPTIKVVTFRLRGWCVLGVFLLPTFTRLGHERQDLLSPCDEMHVCTD